MTTLSLLRYDGLRNRHWAFWQMGAILNIRRKAKGLRFGKLMGSGAGNGFSLKPNFGVYAFLGHWESDEAARAYRRESRWWRAVERHTSEILTVSMRSTMTHGEWGGKRPFPDHRDDYDPARPVAVITRARIHTLKMAEFWADVPRTSAAVYNHPERLISVGIGEYPAFMQATFSLWTTGKAMQQFAYRGEEHREIIKKTRERNWYAEEMFTRFQVLGVEGSWRGFDQSVLKF